MNFTIRRHSPGASPVEIVTRARSSSLSALVTVSSGPSTTWSMPAATRSRDARVTCTSPARRPLFVWDSASSGWRRAAPARGSSVSASGPGSFATSSDCTTIRDGAPYGSTS